jgi:cytoskeletal protein CcmA (bactofilin family)
MAWFDRGVGDKTDAKGESERAVPSAAVMPQNDAEAATAPAATAAGTPTAAPAEMGLVGHLFKGSRVTGQLTFQGPARIDGQVDGEIQCHGTLTIGESAEVRAKIFAQVVIVRGKVEGNITAKEKLELFAPARVIGNISTPRLKVTDGVAFDGDCSMGMAKQKAGVASSSALSADSAPAKSVPAQPSDSLS